MPLLTSLLLLIVTARVLGQLAIRYKQPAIVGEMLAGILLGPALLNFVHSTPALHGISDLAVFLIVLSAGLEMNLKDVINAMWGRGLVIALLAFFLPLFAGIALGIAFELDLVRSLFLGLCISITALPVAVRILESFKLLNTEIARYAIASAIVNDVIALLVLGVVLNLPQEKSLTGITLAIGIAIGKLFVFGGLVWGVNELLLRVERSPTHRNGGLWTGRLGTEALFGLVVLFVLIFASVTEVLGFHFVVGAFFGALLIRKEIFPPARYAELENTLGSISGGFLAPVFFAYLGLEFNVMEMRSVSFVIMVLIVSVVSKVAAGWIGGKLLGLPRDEPLRIGIILNGRGIMELVIASIAFEHHFIGQGLFSTLVLMGIFTTTLTPILLGKVLQRSQNEPLTPAPSNVTGG